jgi:hypothetical protein
VRHAGAYDGQSTVIAIDADGGVGLVVMTNSLNGHAAVAGVLDAVPVPWPSEPAPADLSVYTGRYQSGTIGTVEVSQAEDGGLVSSMPAFPGLTSPIWPVDRGSVAGPGGACAFFGFDDAGRPEYLRFQMRVLRRTA